MISTYVGEKYAFMGDAAGRCEAGVAAPIATVAVWIVGQ